MGIGVNVDEALEQEADAIGSAVGNAVTSVASSIAQNATTVVDGSASVGVRVEAGADLVADTAEVAVAAG